MVLLAPRDAEELERLTLVHSPRFQASLDQSHASIGATQRLAKTALWKALSERQRKKGYVGPSVHHALRGGTLTIYRIFRTGTAMIPNPL